MSAEDNLYFILNRALDFTSVASFITKVFTIYVVVVYTPKKMRHFANLILNGMLWNFTGNILYSFAHMTPMLPAECLRLDGLLSAYFEQEFAGHLFIKLVFFTVLNTLIAVVLSFQFRYMEVVHSARISQLHPAWGYVYCFVVHAVSSGIYMVLLDKWRVSVADYPDPSQIASTERLFCYKPSGADKNWAIFCFFAFIFVCLMATVFFSARSIHYLKQKHPAMREKTILLQKRLLRNLLYLTSVPIFLGGIPLLILIAIFYFNELIEARVIVAICMVLLLNHGTIEGITILVVFKVYRTATHKIILAATRTVSKRTSAVKPGLWATNVSLENGK